jgi:nitrogen fixation/metabolism regulation signal transduction histidine kinase
MIPKQINSLESRLKLLFASIILITIALMLALLDSYNLSGPLVTGLFVITVTLYLILATKLYQQLVSPFYQVTNIIEAIRLEDFSFPINSSESSGVVKQLFDKVHQLSEDLQQQKTRYDHTMSFIYKLIEQINSPILMFDHSLQLSHANQAFSEFYGQPWQTLKGHSCIDLGFENIQKSKNQSPSWKLTNDQNQQSWQLKHSLFEDGEYHYHLLVLTTITKEFHYAQQLSWQQIIRVLCHEVRNSLTPIHSLTHSLVENAQSGREPISQSALQALQIIASRSKSLQMFLIKYSKLGKEASLNRSNVSVYQLFNKVISLFSEATITMSNNYSDAVIYVDPILLEQVLINLVKNAMDASTNGQKIHLSFEQAKSEKIIRIIDSGTGISNSDNLFVPFYTTKENGQGIGLTFSRKIIEQHGGSLNLYNRSNAQGTEAIIRLKDKLQLK